MTPTTAILFLARIARHRGIRTFSFIIFLLLVLRRDRALQKRADAVRRSILNARTISHGHHLKPVHGMEERLEQNLESFFQQISGLRNHHPAPAARTIQRSTLAERLRLRYPQVKKPRCPLGPPTWPNAKCLRWTK